VNRSLLKTDSTWTTTDEKNFITDLGSCAPRERMQVSRIDLLKKYIKFISTVRHNFGRMDKKEVLNHADKELKCEKKKKE
jgi:hypothetical protein